MICRLTLSIDENITREIKAYASRKKLSVSSLTEAYYIKLLEVEKKPASFVSFLDKYAGSIKKEVPIDIKKEMEAYKK